MKTTKDKILNIILLGPPGSGKSAQALMLTHNFKLVYISTGDFARNIAIEDSERGRIVKVALARGELVPDYIINEYVGEKISKLNSSCGVILDGFPRDLAQAYKAENIFKENKRKFLVLYVKVSPNNIIKRLTSRRICSKCGKVYSLVLDKENKCKSCGGKLIKRRDDRPFVIKKRITEYLKETRPVLNYFKKKKLLVEINGNESIENVYREILEKINK